MPRKAILIFTFCVTALAQNFTQRGFVETGLAAYARSEPNDSGHFVGDALFRYEAFYKLSPSWQLNGGFDARTDTHRQDERIAHLDWQDRGLQRPAFSIRRLSARYTRGGLTVEAGKQFVRWGKADLLNPTDRWAPQDYLSVVNTDFLAVTALRVTYERGSNTVDAVMEPRFTPSRTPLWNQRWTPYPELLGTVPAAFNPSRPGVSNFPARPSFGVRVNHVGRRYEASAIFYDGFQLLPAIAAAPLLTLVGGLPRFYPRLRLYGFDAAVPLPWFTLKTEAAFYSSPTKRDDEYLLYVLQAERQIRELTIIAGYAGEVVTASRNPLSFNGERGLARAVLGRAQYALDSSRTLSTDFVVRQNGAGSFLRLQYSQTLGQHWRLSGGYTWLHGAVTDFLGEYRRNSYASLVLRYSF